MAQERIVIVEDEAVVAEDLRATLIKLGYRVIGMADTGADAIAVAERERPDIVLMDIRLKGAMDGIEAAETITVQQNIPVTYLTAYADDKTLERAKATMPYGYILKPFDERDINTTLQIALYKHRMQSLLEKMDDWPVVTLRHVAAPILTTDDDQRITYMNLAAEELLGQKLSLVIGEKLTSYLHSPTPGHGSVRRPNGETQDVVISENAMTDSSGQPRGKVFLLRLL